jgi:hypothetical protein
MRASLPGAEYDMPRIASRMRCGDDVCALMLEVIRIHD